MGWLIFYIIVIAIIKSGNSARRSPYTFEEPADLKQMSEGRRQHRKAPRVTAGGETRITKDGRTERWNDQRGWETTKEIK